MRTQDAARLPLDRREFLVVAGAAALSPVASLIPAGPAAAAVTGPEFADDWSIDDQWQGYPRYTDSGGYARPARYAPPVVAPVDANFVDY